MVSWGCLASKKARSSVTCGMAMIRFFFTSLLFTLQLEKICISAIVCFKECQRRDTRVFIHIREEEFNKKNSHDSRKTKNLLIIMVLRGEMWALILWKFYRSYSSIVWRVFHNAIKKLVNWPLNKSSSFKSANILEISQLSD